MPEHWKDIPGFEGRYRVSDQGRVMSAAKGPWRLLSPVSQGTGYLTVTVSKPGVNPKIRGIHRLVAAAFLGDPTGYVIRHLDGDPHNNCLENLAIGTVAENNRDILRHGRHRNANATHCPRGHPYDDEHTYYRPDRPGRFCKTCANENRRQRSLANSAKRLP